MSGNRCDSSQRHPRSTLRRYRTEQDVTEVWEIRQRVGNALRHGAGSPVAIRASAHADQRGSQAVG